MRDIDWIDEALRLRVEQRDSARQTGRQEEIDIVDLMIDRLLDDRAALQKRPVPAGTTATKG